MNKRSEIMKPIQIKFCLKKTLFLIAVMTVAVLCIMDAACESTGNQRSRCAIEGSIQDAPEPARLASGDALAGGCELQDAPVYITPNGKSKAVADYFQPARSRSNVIKSEPINCTLDSLGICKAHEMNLSGQGVSIALIDSEFYMDRLAEREMPRKLIKLYNASYSQAERHGTACAELIADVAPNVTLYLFGLEGAASEEDFLEVIQEISKLDRKIDIVSCSSDFDVGLFDGEDEICKAISNLTARGTIWINSAGSGGQSHWSGQFQDADEDDFNEFAVDDETIEFAAERGDLITATLSWNDSSSRAVNDFDLYIIAPDGSSAVSRYDQKGIYGQRPVEFAWKVANVNGNYSIKIKKYKSSGSNVTFQLLTSHDLGEHNVESSSLAIIASCPDVIAVGAVDWATMQIESFSPRGPTIDGRIKPDLVAPTNVTTSSYLPDMFNGTSSSAPYVAAMMALVMEKYGKSGMTARDMLQLLLDNALDLGPPGVDNTYGYGLANVKFLNKL